MIVENNLSVSINPILSKNDKIKAQNKKKSSKTIFIAYQIEIESSEIVGLERSPDISTSPWLYHISKLH